MNTQRHSNTPCRHDPNNQCGVIKTCWIKKPDPFFKERLSAIQEASNYAVNAPAKGRVTQYLISVDKGRPIIAVFYKRKP